MRDLDVATMQTEKARSALQGLLAGASPLDHSVMGCFVRLAGSEESRIASGQGCFAADRSVVNQTAA